MMRMEMSMSMSSIPFQWRRTRDMMSFTEQSLRWGSVNAYFEFNLSTDLQVLNPLLYSKRCRAGMLSIPGKHALLPCIISWWNLRNGQAPCFSMPRWCLQMSNGSRKNASPSNLSRTRLPWPVDMRLTLDHLMPPAWCDQDPVSGPDCFNYFPIIIIGKKN